MRRSYLLSNISYLLSIICGRPRPRARSGFTLVEMLTVVVIIALLASAMGLSAQRAREQARRVKAEAECRELVGALIQYHDFYKEWPNNSSGEKNADKNVLGPLLDASENPKGIVFLNLALQGNDWKDPWGNTYKIFFPDGSKVDTRTTALETCVSFPFRKIALLGEEVSE